jgi:hypothetical protein
VYVPTFARAVVATGRVDGAALDIELTLRRVVVLRQRRYGDRLSEVGSGRADGQ